jgi:ATP-dependent Clp protease ATP-binding subunit ClpC
MRISYTMHRTVAMGKRKLLANVQKLMELETEIEHLDREKENAVAACDFERAAHLRDQADKLKEERLACLRQSRKNA